MLFIQVIQNIFFKCIKRFPSLKNLIYDSETHYFLRKLVLFIFGILVGWMLYGLVLLPITLIPQKLLIYFGAVSVTLLGLGCAFSIQVRCISILILLGFCGKAGRSVLRTIIFTFILVGPIDNIIVNTKEVVRVFSCSTSLTYNLTKAKFDLLTSPFSDSLFNLEKNLSQIQQNFKLIKDVVEPIKHEVEDYNVMKIVQRRESNMNRSVTKV